MLIKKNYVNLTYFKILLPKLQCGIIHQLEKIIFIYIKEKRKLKYLGRVAFRQVAFRQKFSTNVAYIR